MPALYGAVTVFALARGLAGVIGLQPLQAEGLLLTLLVLVAHILSWEFMTRAAQN